MLTAIAKLVMWSMLPGERWANNQVDRPSRAQERRHMSTFEQVREWTETPAQRRLRDSFDPGPAERFQAQASRSALAQILNW
jgi:hypothetical protein